MFLVVFLESTLKEEYVIAPESNECILMHERKLDVYSQTE